MTRAARLASAGPAALLGAAWVVGVPIASALAPGALAPAAAVAWHAARWWVPAVAAVVVGSALIAVPLGALGALSPGGGRALSRGRELGAAVPLVLGAWVLGHDAAAASGGGPPWPALLVALGWRGVALAGVVRMETLQALAGAPGAATLALGGRPWRVALRHAVPAALPGVLSAGTVGAAWLVLLDAAGTLVRATPTARAPGWGALLAEGATPGWLRAALVGALVVSALAGRSLLAALLSGGAHAGPARGRRVAGPGGDD